MPPEEKGPEAPKPAALTRDEANAQDRAAFLAELHGASPGEPNKPVPAPGKVPAPAASEDDEDELDDAAADADVEDDDQDDAEDEDEDDLDADDEGDQDDDEDEEPDDADAAKDEAAEKSGDPETDKRIAKVRRAEQRSKAALAEERSRFEKERDTFVAEWKPKVEAVQRFERLASRARFAPVEVLRELGLTDDDFDSAAADIYAASTAGKKDPRAKDISARQQRERERDAKIDEIAKQNAELKKQLEGREAEAAAHRDMDTYVTSITKAVPKVEGTPLTASLMRSNPKRARAELAQVAHELWQKHGKQPPPKMVVRVHERRCAHRLKELGIGADPAAPAKPADARPTKKTAAPAGKKPAAANQDPDEEVPPTRENILRELAEQRQQH